MSVQATETYPQFCTRSRDYTDERSEASNEEEIAVGYLVGGGVYLRRTSYGRGVTVW